MKRTMKRIIKQVLVGMLCLTLLQSPVFLLQTYAKPASLYSAGAVLMDAESGRVLYGKNEKIPYAMASTTKIMTCILALELGDENQVVTISENAARQPDVQMNAKAGEQYYLKDLLHSTMLESHNDSAVAVAEAIGGTVERFVQMMDAKAEAIGCIQTNFVTPNGLDGADEGGDHRTTAKELAMILRYCIETSSKAKTFLEITGTKTYEFQELNQKRYVMCQNHNSLLSSYEGTITGKTGFTSKAGYCFAGAAKRGEKTMIIALLGAGGYPNKSYKWKDAYQLLDYGFHEFSYETIGKEQWIFQEIPVADGMKETVKINTDAKTFTYLLGPGEAVQCKVEVAKQLQAPVEKNMVVGRIYYELNGKIIEQFKVFAEENVEKSTFWNRSRKWLRNIQDFVLHLIKK